jgi:hypothetical protein
MVCPRASMSLGSLVPLSAGLSHAPIWPSYCPPDRRDWRFAPLKLRKRIDFLPNHGDPGAEVDRSWGAPMAPKRDCFSRGFG